MTSVRGRGIPSPRRRGGGGGGEGGSRRSAHAPCRADPAGFPTAAAKGTANGRQPPAPPHPGPGSRGAAPGPQLRPSVRAAPRTRGGAGGAGPLRQRSPASIPTASLPNGAAASSFREADGVIPSSRGGGAGTRNKGIKIEGEARGTVAAAVTSQLRSVPSITTPAPPRPPPLRTHTPEPRPRRACAVLRVIYRRWARERGDVIHRSLRRARGVSRAWRRSQRPRADAWQPCRGSRLPPERSLPAGTLLLLRPG